MSEDGMTMTYDPARDQRVTARRLYDAYNAGGDPATAGLNFRGEPCPAWADLPPNIRAKWEAAAAVAHAMRDKRITDALSILAGAEACDGPQELFDVAIDSRKALQS